MEAHKLPMSIKITQIKARLFDLRSQIEMVQNQYQQTYQELVEEVKKEQKSNSPVEKVSEKEDAGDTAQLAEDSQSTNTSQN